jgi:hypothetical protein
MSSHRHPGGCIRQPDRDEVLPPSVKAHLAVEEASALGALGAYEMTSTQDERATGPSSVPAYRT